MKTILLSFLLLLNILYVDSTIAQPQVEVSKKEMVMPLNGNLTMDLVIGKIGNFLFTKWTKSSGTYLCKSSVITGETEYCQEIHEKTWPNHYVIINEQVVKISETRPKDALEFSYAVADENGIFPAPQTLATVQLPKENRISRDILKKNNDGLLIVVWNEYYDGITGKKACIVDIESDLSATLRYYDTEARSGFHLSELRLDNMGNVNGIMYPQTQKLHYFISFPPAEKKAWILPVNLDSFIVYSLNYDCRDGQVVMAGLCSRLNKFETLHSFCINLNLASKEAVMSDPVKVESEFIASMMLNRSKMQIALNTSTVNLNKDRDVSMLNTFRTQSSMSPLAEIKNGIFFIHFDKNGLSGSVEIPESKDPNINILERAIKTDNGSIWLITNSGESFFEIAGSDMKKALVQGSDLKELKFDHFTQIGFVEDNQIAAYCWSCRRKDKFTFYLISFGEN